MGLPTQRASTSGGEIAYVDEGEGPPLVLLHGFPLSSFQWRRFIPAFAGPMRVIAPDLLGAGDSDKPESAPLDIRAQAGYVRALLAHLGIERFAVIGAGTGGGVAQLLALGGGVEALVLLDSIAFGDWPSDPTREVQSYPPEQLTQQVVDAVMRTAFDLAMKRRSRMSDAELDEFVRPYAGADGARAFARAVHALDGEGLLGHEAAFAAWELPVLILWGEDDAFQPVELGERLNDAMPTSTLGLLPGCGHFVTEDAPETLAPMIYEYLRVRYLRSPHGHGGAGEASADGIVRIQLERKPAWVDAGSDEEDDEG